MLKFLLSLFGIFYVNMLYINFCEIRKEKKIFIIVLSVLIFFRFLKVDFGFRLFGMMELY